VENQVEKEESLSENSLYSKPPFTHIYAGLAALAILLLFFTRVFGSDIIYGSDVFLDFFFKRAYGFGEMLKGNIPLWNPHQFCGYSFVGAYQSALFYPLNLIFLIWNPETALALSTFLHLFLAWLGMYIYMYHLTKKSFPSCMAGLVFMMSTIITSRVYAGHITIQCSYPWIPFIILVLDKSLRNRSLAWACTGSLFFGMQILAGYPGMVYYTSLLVFIYSMGWLWCRFWENKTVKTVIRSLWPGFVIGVGGALVAAIQLLPTYFHAQHSVRAGGVTYEFASSFSFPPESFITYIAPYFFGSMADSPYWGRWFLWEYIPYIGILPLVFLIMGAFRGKQAEGKISSVGCRVDEKEEQTTSERENPLPSPLATRYSQLERSESRLPLFMALVGLFAALIALGGYTWFFKYVYTYVPGFSHLRGHSKILFLFSFAGAAGTGFMVHALRENREQYFFLLKKTWKILAGIAVILLIIYVISTESEGGRSLFWKVIVNKVLHLKDDVGPNVDIKNEDFIKKSYTTARSAVLIALILVAMSAGLFRLLLTDFKYSRILLSVTIAVLIIADLFWASGRYITGISDWKYRFDSEIVKALRSDSVVPTRIASLRHTKDLSSGSLDNISHVGGYDPALSGRYVEYCNVMSGKDPDEPTIVSTPIRPGKLLRLMGITHVLASYEKPIYPASRKVLSKRGAFNLYKINNPVPRAFIVHNVHVIQDKKELLDRLAKISPLKEGVVESDIGLKVKPLPKGGKDEVEITGYSAHEISIKVDACSAGLLVLTDTYYPAWKAKVDGKPVEIIPTDHLFRGVAVSKGEHEVVFYYDKSLFTAGCFVSLFSFCVLLGLISGNFIRRKFKKEILSTKP